jgi:hypothetical protein
MKQLDLFDSLAKDDKAKKEKQAAYSKAYYEANKEKKAAYRKAYKEANKEKQAAYSKAYREANKEKKAATDKAYYERNREKRNAESKAYYEANKESCLAAMKVYQENNKEKIAAKDKAYKEANKEEYAALYAKRRASKLKQIPVRLRDCSHEKQRILQTYKLRNILSEATGVQHHVDHMWPLSDGGPHWSGNLQVITAYENLSKNASVCEATKSTIIKSLESFQSERTI